MLLRGAGDGIGLTNVSLYSWGHTSGARELNEDSYLIRDGFIWSPMVWVDDGGELASASCRYIHLRMGQSR